ncbi:flavin reductase family protein [Variovorax sp.]|uniref:flavin reductase family protein n=1 Tax=Variovorax sp. TaxID=1871043 RepID=UPI003BACE97C
MRGEFRAIESLRCEPNVGASDFRRAMRCLVGAVTVVTSTDGQTPVGLTATAVTSFSAEPARILACVNLQGSSFRTIAQSRRMAVNLLALDQSALALAFSRQGEAGERFDPAHWETLVTGAPVLRGALAVFDCVVDEMMVAHSHAMLIGEVKAARITDAQGLPLLYACGQFTTLRDECVPA